MTSRALGELSRAQTDDVMEFVVEQVVPLLGASDVVFKRQGAIETVSGMGHAIVYHHRYFFYIP